MLVDSSGAMVNEYIYDSFGNIVDQTGTVVNPYTYTARELDTESGLYYYRARYYDANTGRFISEDPIGFRGGDVNFFTYTGNNPVNFVDPDGESISAITVIKIIATAYTIYQSYEKWKQFNEKAEKDSKLKKDYMPSYKTYEQHRNKCAQSGLSAGMAGVNWGMSVPGVSTAGPP
jgi:RHS repeat-associated protein